MARMETTRDVWKSVRYEVTPDGHEVEMRYAQWGKGKTLVRKWEIFRDGTRAGYAVNAPDADENFARVMLGYVRNTETGVYEQVPATPARAAEIHTYHVEMASTNAPGKWLPVAETEYPTPLPALALAAAEGRLDFYRAQFPEYRYRINHRTYHLAEAEALDI